MANVFPIELEKGSSWVGSGNGAVDVLVNVLETQVVLADINEDSETLANTFADIADVGIE